MVTMKLTRADRKILEILQQDSSVTNVELAERVGLSPSPCLRRVKQLEASGLISGYVALLDRRKARLDLLAYVEVQVDRHSETAAEAVALPAWSAAAPAWSSVFCEQAISDRLAIAAEISRAVRMGGLSVAAGR